MTDYEKWWTELEEDDKVRSILSVCKLFHEEIYIKKLSYKKSLETFFKNELGSQDLLYYYIIYHNILFSIENEEDKII